MNSFIQLRDTVVSQFNAISAQYRILAAVLMTIAVAVLACMACLGGEEPRVEVLRGISIPPSRLPAFEIAFAKAGLDDYVIDQDQVKVLRSEKSRYVAALADAQLLPPNFGEIVDEAIRAGGPFDTALQKAERIKNARQRELALIISSMDGIDNAMVIYDEEKARGIQRKSVLTASVSVKASDNEKLTGERVRTIRQLVAAAVAGLEPHQVSVTDLNTGRNFPAGDEATSEMAGNHYSELKSHYELQWMEKIHAGLSWVPGIVVSVDVALNSDTAAKQPESPRPQWTPKAVKVTLSVPTTYVRDIWRRRQNLTHGQPIPNGSTDELQALQAQVAADLRSHVANLIPRERDDVDTRLDVRLTFFDDLNSTADGIVVAQYKDAAPWSASPWQFIVLGLLATVGMIALRRYHGSGRAATDVPDHTDVPSQSSANISDPISSDLIANGEVSQLPAQVSSSDSTPSTTTRGEFTSRRSVTSPGQQFSSRLVPNLRSVGIELNDLTSSRLAHSAATDNDAPDADSDFATRPFRFIDEASPDDLAALLIHENAQIIAIVFSHLEADHAAFVLKQLPSSLQVDVIRRLSDLDDLSDEVVREIERSLEARLTAQLHRREKRNAGVRAVSNILGAVDDDSRQTILSSLKHRHRDLAEQLQPTPTPTADVATPFEAPVAKSPRHKPPGRPTIKRLTFDDVAHLDGDALCIVLSATGTRDSLLALSGVDADVMDRLAEAMKPSEADRLRIALARLGPTSPGDVLASQRAVAQMASQLKTLGRLQRKSQLRPPLAA